MSEVEHCVPEWSNIKVVVNEGNTLDIGDKEGVMVLEKMNDMTLSELAVMKCLLQLRMQIYFHLLLQWWATWHFHPCWS